jgi:dTDP-4-amino-4,6-dideoxygalactose transaminase
LLDVIHSESILSIGPAEDYATVTTTGRKQRLFLSPPHMSGYELPLVREAFESNYIAPVGPMIDAFEREFSEATGFAHAVALASGTAAIHLGLRLLGVGPGDSVITSTLTFIGGVSPIVFQGAAPVFIDCDPASWSMDVGPLEDELLACARRGRLPKAIVPTDLYGQPCDLDAILAVADRFGVAVLCDVAESLGATYKGRHAGKGAWAAAFSFNGNKIITSSGGGMLASDDGAMIQRAHFLAHQARNPGLPHHEHSEIGYNYRMSNVVAAIGRGQLRVLSERVEARRTIFERYRASLHDLPGISFMPEARHSRASRWLTIILIDPEAFGADREQVRRALEADNIESRPIWKPMHLQPVFKDARVVGGRIAERLFETGLCLPSGTQMTSDDIDRVASIIRRCGR